MLQAPRSKRWQYAVLAALGVTAATALISLAARAPLSRSTPINAASTRAPVQALLVLVLGAAIVALVALAALILPLRRRKRDDEPTFGFGPPRVRWPWKLVALLFPLALGAALIAAAVLGVKTGHPASRLAVGGATERARASAAAANGGSSNFLLPSWLPWTALAIVLVAIAAGAWVLARRRSWLTDEPSEHRSARAAVEAAIGALDTAGDPRTAVLAAYAAMERTLAAHGIARTTAEAPREYLRRALAATPGAGREAQTLTVLFEEARFSSHPIPERVRTLALSALGTLRTHLQRANGG